LGLGLGLARLALPPYSGNTEGLSDPATAHRLARLLGLAVDWQPPAGLARCCVMIGTPLGEDELQCGLGLLLGGEPVPRGLLGSDLCCSSFQLAPVRDFRAGINLSHL
jgi:hypothetical protein